MLEEMRFKSLIKLIEMRNNLLINQVYPALAVAYIKVGAKQLEEELIEEIIGIATVHMLKIWLLKLLNSLRWD